MESITCGVISKNGIKGNINRNCSMNKTQSALLTTAVAISSVFAMNAQSNDLAVVTKKNTSTEFNKSRENPVQKGDYTDAIQMSADEKIIVLYVSGPKVKPGDRTKKPVAEYGRLLRNAFKHPKYSKYAKMFDLDNVRVIYNESDKEGRKTGVTPIVNGQDYVSPEGQKIFSPAQIVKQHVDAITEDHMKRNGIKVVMNQVKTQPSNDLVVAN